MASEGNLEAEVERLLNVNKQMRLAGEVTGTKKAVDDILKLCFEAKDWKSLNEHIVVLSKRRCQLKQTLSDFQYIDSSERDQGSNGRKKSQSIVALVNDKDRVIEVRQKAAANKDK